MKYEIKKIEIKIKLR